MSKSVRKLLQCYPEFEKAISSFPMILQNSVKIFYKPY